MPSLFTGFDGSLGRRSGRAGCIIGRFESLVNSFRVRQDSIFGPIPLRLDAWGKCRRRLSARSSGKAHVG